MQRAELSKRLAHAAEELYRESHATYTDTGVHSYLRDTAAALAEFAQQCEDEYVRVHGRDDESVVPTVAQGVALAWFIRSRKLTVNGKHIGVTVALGGAGLPDTYLHVRFSDGYEGGIDPDGKVST